MISRYNRPEIQPEIQRRPMIPIKKGWQTSTVQEAAKKQAKIYPTRYPSEDIS
jgi:hypothetical protein